jgi:type II secretory pathway pseudopilin PulG
MPKTAHPMHTPRGGFTLAEVLAAMLFMAIVIPVAVQGLMIANRAGVVAERKSVAARLADSLLTEMVLADAWQDAEDDGDFGEDYPDYAWKLTSDAWEEDTMLLLTVEVFYAAQGRQYSVRVSTLVEEVSDDDEDEETAEETA